MDLQVVREWAHSTLGSIGVPIIAGGAVRDWMMKEAPKDYDIFLLDSSYAQADRIRGLLNVTNIETTPGHQSEPYLVSTFQIPIPNTEAICQVMTTLHQSVSELLDSFDWNVSMFAYDGVYHSLEHPANIKPGMDLKLHKVTFPRATLRRGFRFSERFKMNFRREDMDKIMQEALKEKR